MDRSHFSDADDLHDLYLNLADGARNHAGAVASWERIFARCQSSRLKKFGIRWAVRLCKVHQAVAPYEGQNVDSRIVVDCMADSAHFHFDELDCPNAEVNHPEIQPAAGAQEEDFDLGPPAAAEHNSHG